jgi:hypothetical protein
MCALLERLASIMFIVCAIFIGPVLLLALWTHGIALEFWRRLNHHPKDPVQSRRGENQRGRAPARFQPRSH